MIPLNLQVKDEQIKVTAELEQEDKVVAEIKEFTGKSEKENESNRSTNP